MLFNSLQFLLFLPLIFFLYWFVFNRNLRLQNLLIVVASFVFYGWWDWRFLILMGFTSLWAWLFGLLDSKYPRGRKFFLALSCVINLGILGYFKYYNFFLDQAILFLNAVNIQANPSSLRIILPVGISFYTFQALSYTIDVFRKHIVPTKDPIAFLAFISFFPQLVAGPIERATNLLPQFLKPRTFEYDKAVVGCRQMLWGFFKKMVVADNCAAIANKILNTWEDQSGLAILIGIVCFSVQIYCDFSGYSDIAIGCSRLFGINIMRNFAYPYFSRDIAEFWRGWHISLTTWFRDYLYIPLGGSRCSKLKQIRNTLVIFIVSGFWHGANWTFIAWGAFHAFCFVPLLLANSNRKHIRIIADSSFFPSLKESIQVFQTFFLVVIGWGLFRAPDIHTAINWYQKIASIPFTPFDVSSLARSGITNAVLFSLILFIVEWINRKYEFGFSRLPSSRLLRRTLYVVLTLVTILYRGDQSVFIYFQF